jgi:hypothetical protein
MLRLPENLEREFMHELIVIEEQTNMPYITSFERIGRQQGRQQGEAQMLLRLIAASLALLVLAFTATATVAAPVAILDWWDTVSTDGRDYRQVANGAMTVEIEAGETVSRIQAPFRYSVDDDFQVSIRFSDYAHEGENTNPESAVNSAAGISLNWLTEDLDPVQGLPLFGSLSVLRGTGSSVGAEYYVAVHGVNNAVHGEVLSTQQILTTDAAGVLTLSKQGDRITTSVIDGAEQVHAWDYDLGELGITGDIWVSIDTANGAYASTRVHYSGLDMTRGSARSVTEIYIATLRYAPDNEGLQYWIDELETNPDWTPLSVAQSFFDQPLVQQEYPADQGYGPLIEALYQNIFGRAADAEGYAYWLEELETGRVSRNQMILALIEGGWANPEASQDMARFDNLIQVGLAFAAAQASLGIVYSELDATTQDAFRQVGRDLLAEVTADRATRDAAIAGIAERLADF